MPERLMMMEREFHRHNVIIYRKFFDYLVRSESNQAGPMRGAPLPLAAREKVSKTAVSHGGFFLLDSQVFGRGRQLICRYFICHAHRADFGQLMHNEPKIT